MKQSKRINNFNKFNEDKSGIMFATDVIARGIDFPEVDLIIQVDVPQDPNFYIHRIGRTARKGLIGHVRKIYSSKIPIFYFEEFVLFFLEFLIFKC